MFYTYDILSTIDFTIQQLLGLFVTVVLKNYLYLQLIDQSVNAIHQSKWDILY